MTIDLDSGSGLFDKLGKLVYLLNTINTDIGNESSGWPKEVNDVLVEYDAGTNAERAAVEDLLSALTQAQSGVGTLKEEIRTAARDTLIAMADADDPLPEATVAEALKVLIQQMEDAAESLDASEPSIASLVRGPRYGAITAATKANPCQITSTAHGLSTGEKVTISGVGGMTEINDIEFTAVYVDANNFQLYGINSTGYTTYTSGGVWRANHGSGVLRLSILDSQGRSLQNALAEDIVATCDNDTTSGSESFGFLGEAAAPSKLSHIWPAGSGADTDIACVEAADGLLTNGDFETFTVTNTPDDWTIDTGSAGTDILEENTNYVRGTSGLEIDGDGSTLVKISQAITGLEARTPYAINLWTMIDSAPAAGVLQVDLWDGSAVIQDDEGNSCSFTVDLTAHATFFQPQGAFFRLPNPVPASVTLRVHLTTALSNTTSLFIDEITLVEASRIYTAGGPYAALFAGASDFAIEDEFLITVTNARAGAFQEACDRFFDTADSDLIIPSVTGGGETIDDALIA